MADLSLKIRANFDEAQLSFKKLGEEAKASGMTVSQFTKKFQDKHVDQFIAKQKRAGAAIMTTRGDLAAMEAQYKSYGYEIERLIKASIDPESEAVTRLKKEYESLSENIETRINM